jgi:hypothetical protein
MYRLQFSLNRDSYPSYDWLHNSPLGPQLGRKTHKDGSLANLTKRIESSLLFFHSSLSKMHQIQFNPSILKSAAFKNVIITGGAAGIGAATARIFNDHGAYVVIGDLREFQSNAEGLIASFAHPTHAIFVPVNITEWEEMKTLFKSAVQAFGEVHVVVANAGIMEPAETLDMDNVDDEGELRESKEAFKVFDVNMKGTLNSMFVTPTRRQSHGF